MKKIFTVFLIIFSLLLLCGCNDDKITPDNNNDDNDDYKDIVCRTYDSYSNEIFAFKNSNYLLSLSIPSEWSFSKDADDSYTVVRDGIEIGELFSGSADDLDEWESVALNNLDVYGLMSINKYIEKHGTGESLSFRYRMCFLYSENGEERELTLTVDYAEVSEETAEGLFRDSEPIDISSYTHFGVLSELKGGSLLILGNSFIGFSNVGEILKEMMENNNKKCKVTADARGNANVRTFVQDSSLMSDIKAGKYDAVFICGLYSSAQVTVLGELVSACENSDTTLVVFPAHNEDRNSIESARSEYTSIEFLDWKGEIDALIESGMDRWDFCVDDYYDHSTALAGYVGAHMIYRAIYGAVPEEQPEYSLKGYDVEDILGDYIITAYTEDINSRSINYIE